MYLFKRHLVAWLERKGKNIYIILYGNIHHKLTQLNSFGIKKNRKKNAENRLGFTN